VPKTAESGSECSKDHILFAAAGNNGYYDPLRRIPCAYAHDFAFTFRVMARADAFIALMTEDLERSSLAWEIQLGVLCRIS
jgi:hypothetical protein